MRVPLMLIGCSSPRSTNRRCGGSTEIAPEPVVDPRRIRIRNLTNLPVVDDLGARMRRVVVVVSSLVARRVGTDDHRFSTVSVHNRQRFRAVTARGPLEDKPLCLYVQSQTKRYRGLNLLISCFEIP